MQGCQEEKPFQSCTCLSLALGLLGNVLQWCSLKHCFGKVQGVSLGFSTEADGRANSSLVCSMRAMRPQLHQHTHAASPIPNNGSVRLGNSLSGCKPCLSPLESTAPLALTTCLCTRLLHTSLFIFSPFIPLSYPHFHPIILYAEND